MSRIAEEFRTAFAAELRGLQASAPTLAPFVAALQALDCSAPRSPAATHPPESVAAHLSTAIETQGCSDALARSVDSLADVVSWFQIFQGDGIDPGLAKGLVAGQFAGQVGLIDSPESRVGLFLLTPDFHYPLHQHAAEELYFVTSGELTIQHGRSGAPFVVGPGEFSVTPPHRPHSLTTGDGPCLILHAWVGAVDGDVWWWERSGEGDWRRDGWERQPDASWLKVRSEPVTRAVLDQAGEP